MTKANLPSRVPASLPHFRTPSLPPLPQPPRTHTGTPTTPPARSGRPGHTLPFPRTRGQRQELFCRVTTRGGRRSRRAHLRSRSHPTHQAALGGQRSLVAGPGPARRKGPGATPRRTPPPTPPRPLPRPCSARRPPRRPGLLEAAQGTAAGREARTGLTGVERHGGASGGGAGRLGLAGAAKGKGREEAGAAGEMEARCWRQLGCDEHLIQIGHWR